MNVILSHTYTDRTTQITAKECNVFHQRGHVHPAIKAPIGAAKLLINMMANASSGLIIESRSFRRADAFQFSSSNCSCQPRHRGLPERRLRSSGTPINMPILVKLLYRQIGVLLHPFPDDEPDRIVTIKPQLARHVYDGFLQIGIERDRPGVTHYQGGAAQHDLQICPGECRRWIGGVFEGAAPSPFANAGPGSMTEAAAPVI
ncbi:hypothetical protein HJA87_01225 [Rhizobium bangladeshense]|uniref:Uncharacterized protein n=1 Tax=Rhizobium bangladeshense TaxID=1138189 RepID=A0ABS7LAN4_9HYPH|nr:hypothetical protein [Rhizobium bangladeshense]MBY3588517.1 hypothetical protein [Rhizobium bangladeshense]